VRVLANVDSRTGGSEATTKPNGGAATDGTPHRRAADILERALLRTGGTVTAFLETVTGEVVEADMIEQGVIEATAASRLEVDTGHSLVSRQAILRGRTSRRDYLYAETLFVPDRLPDGVPHLLETTRDPIGRLLAARGVGMTRTVLGAPDRTPAVARLGPGNSVDAAIFARRYRVDTCGVAVMLIDEWFLPDLRDAVLRAG
jgi:chorismate-pyruvate lyase